MWFVLNFRLSEYYVVFIYFQAAVSALLAVSVLYVEKNQNKYYVIFENSTNIKLLYLWHTQDIIQRKSNFIRGFYAMFIYTYAVKINYNFVLLIFLRFCTVTFVNLFLSLNWILIFKTLQAVSLYCRSKVPREKFVIISWS